MRCTIFQPRGHGTCAARSILLLLAACGTNMTPQPDLAPTLPSCVPDRDGIITEAELPVALGATATYYASTNRAVRRVAA